MISTIAHTPLPDPFDWVRTLEGLALRAVEGLEQATETGFRRSILTETGPGVMTITLSPDAKALRIETTCGAATDLISPVRAMLDLDRDMRAVNVRLAQDPFLAPMVMARPALRVLGGWAGFEAATRAVIGQQVSMERARFLTARFVKRAGTAMPQACDAISHLYPTPQQTLAADLSDMGMPGARARTLQAVAQACLDCPDFFQVRGPVEALVERLLAIKGIGPWSAHYIAMRACGHPDAFPSGDAGLLRGASCEGVRPSAEMLKKQAERWRPWRAYAAQHLWAHSMSDAVD